MPELPEVEVMCKRLQQWKQWRITDIAIDERMSAAAALRYLPGDEFRFLIDQTITGVFRRGKFLIFMLSGDNALLCHNAMSGYWDDDRSPWTFDYVEAKRNPTTRDVRVMLRVAQADHGYPLEQCLQFHDARKFGSLRLVTAEQLARKLSQLGPDAIDTTCSYEARAMTDAEFAAEAISRDTPIKELLMEQSIVAGIGNIYATEACWDARVAPWRLSSSLTELALAHVFQCAQDQLREAINTTLDYSRLNVYRRKRCTCGGTIISSKDKGRTTYWCPRCQS